MGTMLLELILTDQAVQPARPIRYYRMVDVVEEGEES